MASAHPKRVPPEDAALGDTGAKRHRGGAAPRDPAKIINWNCRSLVARCQGNWEELSAFLVREDADCIVLTETWLEPRTPVGESAPRRHLPKLTDLQVSLLSFCEECGYAANWSCGTARSAGTAVLVKQALGVRPEHVSFSFGGMPGLDAHAHHGEGRCVAVAFAGFDLLAIYTPHRGRSAPQRARRATWTEQLTEHLRVQRAAGRAVVWTGDHNAVWGADDLSHPRWFRQQEHAVDPDRPGARMLAGGAARGTPLADERERGFAGCCDREVDDLWGAAQAGGLFDAWGCEHNAAAHAGAEQRGPARWAGLAGAQQQEFSRMDTDGSSFTWRGVDGNTYGSKELLGRAMRLDHFAVSEALRDRLGACRIVGRRVVDSHGGVSYPGFFGSDHCPIVLELEPAPGGAAAAGSAAAVS